MHKKKLHKYGHTIQNEPLPEGISFRAASLTKEGRIGKDAREVIEGRAYQVDKYLPRARDGEVRYCLRHAIAAQPQTGKDDRRTHTPHQRDSRRGFAEETTQNPPTSHTCPRNLGKHPHRPQRPASAPPTRALTTSPIKRDSPPTKSNTQTLITML